MPKQEFKIQEFHGGTNNKFDARDIADNQNSHSTFSIRRPGRLVLEGSATKLYDKTDINGHTITDIDAASGGFEQGYGLFSFSHDYTMDSTPSEEDTDYVCINDMNGIDIYDPNQSTEWQPDKFTIGSRTLTVKPEYYNVDGALRVCDSNFATTDASADTSAAITRNDVVLSIDNGASGDVTIATGSVIQIDDEVMYVTSGGTGQSFQVIRGYANTKIATHADNTDIYYVNIPKYFGHIKNSRLFEAATSNPVNTWVEDVQTPQVPNNTRTGAFSSPYIASSTNKSLIVQDMVEISTNNFPTEAEKVRLEFSESPAGTGIIKVEATNNTVTFTTSGYGSNASAGHQLGVGNTIVLSNMHDAGAGKDLSVYNGEHVITGVTATTFSITFNDATETLDGSGAIYYADASNWADDDSDFPNNVSVTVDDATIPFLDSGEGDAYNAYNQTAYIHITGQTGVPGFNGVKKAYRDGNDSIFRFESPSHASVSDVAGTTKIQQLIGIVSPKESGEVIPEDLKRKWNFAMSFTYDGPAQEVQESLLTQGYHFLPATQADALTSNLMAEELTSSETGVDVDDGSVFVVNDIIMVDDEQMLVTSISTNTLTVTRGYNGTQKVGHDDNAQVYILAELTPTDTIDWTGFVGAPHTAIKFLYNHGHSGFVGDELIDEAKNRDFSSASDWTEYSPDGSAPSPFNHDSSNQWQEITGTASTNKEGAQLALTGVAPPVPLKTYRISAKIWWDSSDPGTGSIFKYSFGGTVSTAFDVAGTSKSTTYTQDVVASNPTGPLIIYKEGSTTAQFDIDDVSVKEVINSTWNPRINGFKIYMRDVTDGDSSKEWRLFSKVNLNRGTYNIFAADDSELILQQPGTWSSDCKVSTYIDSSIQKGTTLKIKPIDTYLSENLFTEDTIIDAQYKTACTVGRKVYIGNIRQGGRTYPDRMLVSPINKFDTFPETNFIDVAIGDGDSIIKLMSFGDRLLQFKKDKVYVINVSGQSEVLEAEYNNAGINYPSQACKTNDGIAWITSSGLWFFDGQSAQNLTRHIETNPLALPSAGQPIIGFEREGNRLIFTPRINIGLTTTWWIYDLELKALQSYYNGPPMPYSDTGANTFTNMITDTDGTMFFGYVDAGFDAGDTELNFYQWDNDDSGHMDDVYFNYHKTKDFDFGSPAVRKKIYKIYVTYKCTGHSGIKMKYATNGGSTFSDFSTSASTNYNVTVPFSSAGDGSGFANSSGAWAVAELIPSSSINNVYSIQLSLDAAFIGHGTAATGGGTDSIKLANMTDPAGDALTVSGTDGIYNDYNIYLYGGPARYNSRVLENGTNGTTYNGTTKVAKVLTAFADKGYTNSPTNATKFFLGSPASDFEINDITIVYRPKPIK